MTDLVALTAELVEVPSVSHDERALCDIVLRVSELVRVAPEIQELDLNPVIVLGSGARVADARARLEPSIRARRGRRVEY